MTRSNPLRRPLALALALAALGAPTLAAAQGNAKPSAAADDDGRGYEYRFDDDLLDGGGLDSGSPIIRVNPRALRSQLIRPRTSFVPELLKSADGV